jgi:hypothetical protein
MPILIDEEADALDELLTKNPPGFCSVIVAAFLARRLSRPGFCSILYAGGPT